MLTTKKRVLALDVLRGITIAGMILVNNPGSWNYVYAPLRHASWNGCTPTDLVFPFFIFCMGVAMYLSYSSSNFALSGRNVGHAIYRGVILILIGWLLSWFGMFMHQICGGANFWYSFWTFPVEHLRFLGVFPRLGLVCMFSALLLLLFKPRGISWVIGILLVIYCIIISVTNSFDLSTSNVVARVDTALFGTKHIYHGLGIPFDPEGLLSTIPCIAHCLLGVLVGRIIKNEGSAWDKMARIFRFGSVILLIGFLLDYAYPINKSLWSVSYVLVTCGLACLVLSILLWLIDMRHTGATVVEGPRWYKFFENFGANPLFIFCLSTILSILLAVIRVGEHSLWGAWYSNCMVPLFGNFGGSLACAISLVLFMWLITYPLYVRRIYIKI